MIPITVQDNRIRSADPIIWCAEFFFGEIIHCILNKNTQSEFISIPNASYIAVDTSFFN